MTPISLQDVETWAFCPHCNFSMQFRAHIFAEYFLGREIRCPTCREPVDWWREVRRNIEGTDHPFQIFAVVGSRWDSFDVTLEPNRFTTVTFAEHGIPANANIVRVTYGNAGPLLPLEHRGNLPPSHVYPPTVYLYGAPFGEGPPTTTQTTVTVFWVGPAENEEAAQALFDAFEAFANDRLESAVIPANVAVESKLARLLTEFLRSKGIARKNVKSFLSEAATYSYQLNVVLPAVLSLTDAPALPDHIRGGLNGLRALRNDLAHQGHLEAPVSRGQMATLLAAALFGVHYLNFVGPYLVGPSPADGPATGDTPAS